MNQIFSIIRVAARLASLAKPVVSLCRDFRCDPLAHPTLDAMSLTELADLPAAELRARGSV